MSVNKLISYLNKNSIRYVFIKHALAYTAQEVAASAHEPGKMNYRDYFEPFNLSGFGL